MVISPYKTMVYSRSGRMVRSLLHVTVRDGYRAPANFLYKGSCTALVAMSRSGRVAGGRDVRAKITLQGDSHRIHGFAHKGSELGDGSA